MPDSQQSETSADDVTSTLDRRTDLDELRNGGPTETPGMMTTTGGTAGPASVPRRVQPGSGPTTTGAAGTGGMHTPVGGGYSDATTSGTSGAVVSPEPDPPVPGGSSSAE